MCPFCLPFYPLSRRRSSCPGKITASGITHGLPFPRPDCISQPGLPLGYPPCRRCPLRSVLLPMRSPPAVSQNRSFPQAAVHRSNQSPSRLSLREQTEKPGNQKGTRCPADALFCFLGVLLTCGFIPGSGGFPECSAQHRTVRRRAAAKSAAEGAAHHRSKWRCPDQAGMPSVRWQWLCGAGH